MTKDYVVERVLRLLANEIGDNETEMAVVGQTSTSTLSVIGTDGKEITITFK